MYYSVLIHGSTLEKALESERKLMKKLCSQSVQLSADQVRHETLIHQNGSTRIIVRIYPEPGRGTCVLEILQEQYPDQYPSESSGTD